MLFEGRGRMRKDVARRAVSPMLLLGLIVLFCAATRTEVFNKKQALGSLVQNLPSEQSCKSETKLNTPDHEIDENSLHKLSFETRKSLPCPNSCNVILSSSNACKEDVCQCAPDFSGADCSFSSEQCSLVDIEVLLEKVKRHLSGSYDGLSQAHSHIILANQVIQNRVPGDVVEFGVFKGGSASVLAHVFNACTFKRYWFYDSFQGHPSIDPELNPGMEVWTGKHIGTLDEARENVRFLNPNMDESRIVWKKGFFNETLKQELPTTISYLHIDCDWYECHIEILDALYDRVAWGGVIICDDIGFYAFARAGLTHWQLKHRMVMSLRSTFGVGGHVGGGSHFWVKGYKGFYEAEKEFLEEPIWPGGAVPAVF